jgi:hypothetical protein
MTFVRVFRQFPGNSVINNIESVDIIDAPPPSLPLGAATGTVVCVGEFERGALNQPIEITSANDQLNKLGGLGFPTSFSPHDGAVARQSGGTENWNGNGFIWLRNKKWRRLICVRVDNSAGQVEFSRLACLTGGVGPFAAADADAITFERDGASSSTATLSAAKGTILGASGTFTGLDGLTMEIQIDAESSLVTTFTAADASLADVIARINATHAQVIAFDVAGELELRSVIAGGSGSVTILDSSTAAVTLGFPAAVQQVDTYTVNAISAGTYTLRTNLLVAGVSTDFDADYEAAGSETATELRDALLLALQNAGVPGVTFAGSGAADITATGDQNILFTSSVAAEPTASDVTLALTTPGVSRAGFGTGNVLNVASFTATEMATIIDAVASLSAEVTSAGNLRVCNSGTAGTGTLQAISGALVSILGFNVTDIADAADGADVTIPAGTRVQGTADGTVWVTLEDVETGSGGGPFAAKVRPFEDLDTATPSAIGDITTIIDELPDGFSVTNAAAVTRLSAAQLDTRYITAIEATLDLNTPAVNDDFICSARSSATIMTALLTNANQATEGGLSPRKTIVRPLLGTSIADASGTTGQGVGANRNDRLQYVFPGVTTQVPEISSVGARGGTGFSDNGIIETGADSFLASVRSILNPEENAGQALFDTNVGPLSILAMEDAYNPEQGGVGLVLPDYINFKATGITAPIIDQIDGPQFQSDVTSVNPSTQANLADASRRVMADFVIKTLSDISKPYVKKLNTPKRRQALTQQFNVFFNSLLSVDNPDNQRIAAFSVRDDSTNEQRAVGIQAFNVLVQTLPAMLTVLLRVEVGTTVQVEEA